MLDLDVFGKSGRKGIEGGKGKAGLEVLCLGAHCDDIEIGCGGSMLRLLSARKDVKVTWVVFCSSPERGEEARRSAAAFLSGARKTDIIIHEFRDGFLPILGAGPKEAFEILKVRVRPDIVFTHFRGDAHQDHRAVSELTWNTFRDHLILEYEIPKWDGDLAIPNGFMPVTKALARRKIALLLRHYGTQRGRDWFNEEVFLSLMRLRGMESRSPSGLAEAFHCRKLLL